MNVQRSIQNQYSCNTNNQVFKSNSDRFLALPEKKFKNENSKINQKIFIQK